MQELWESQLEDPTRASQTAIDLDSDSRTCPACDETFAAGPVKCPECGLFIGG
jgi:hypothetical protein